MKRSQANIVGYLLMAAAITGIAFGVYIWGKPMLEKSQAQNIASQAEQKLVDLAMRIEDSGIKRTSSTFFLDIPGASVSLMPNDIQVSTKVPYTIYLLPNKEIPINVAAFLDCDAKAFSVGENGELCKNPYMKVSVTNSGITLNDLSNNRTITLSLADHNSVIFGDYMFDIKYMDGKIYFIPRYSLGYLGIDPACVVTAVVTNTGGGQEVTYHVKCRPIVNYKADRCEWIIVEPVGTSTYPGGSGVNIKFEYDKAEIEDVSGISTVCKSLEKIHVKASLS